MSWISVLLTAPRNAPRWTNSCLSPTSPPSRLLPRSQAPRSPRLWPQARLWSVWHTPQWLWPILQCSGPQLWSLLLWLAAEVSARTPIPLSQPLPPASVVCQWAEVPSVVSLWFSMANVLNCLLYTFDLPRQELSDLFVPSSYVHILVPHLGKGALSRKEQVFRTIFKDAGLLVDKLQKNFHQKKPPSLFFLLVSELHTARSSLI